MLCFKFAPKKVINILSAGVLIMSLLSWLNGCSGNSGQTTSAAALLQQIHDGQKPYIVDVREREELQGPLGALPGIKNIPLSEFQTRFTEIPRDRQVILICRSGNRSANAFGFLKKQGYTQILNAEGGMLAVRAAEGK
jgi:rhodanese-related sulfurtransferase